MQPPPRGRTASGSPAASWSPAPSPALVPGPASRGLSPHPVFLRPVLPVVIGVRTYVGFMVDGYEVRV